MKRRIIFLLTIFIMLQFSIIINLSQLYSMNDGVINDDASLFIPRKTTEKLSASIGPVFEEGADGFNLSEGETWDLIVKSVDPSVSFLNFNVGDIVRISITTTNNSLVDSIWIADTIFGTVDYYNTTDETWSPYMGYVGENMFAGYNSTLPYPASDYYLFFYQINVIPLNYSASNHSLVSSQATYLTGSFSHSDPLSPNINGTWSMWNGTATTPGSIKVELTFNSRGMAINRKYYINGTTDWKLIYEEGLPTFGFISPKNVSYFYTEVPIIVENYTNVDKAWFRYNSGAGWMGNYSLSYDGNYFTNTSISWNEGNYQIQVFGNDSQSEIAMIEEWFNINTSLPWNISLNFDEDIIPRIALDSLGKAHVVWFGNESGTYEVYYTTNKDGHFGNKIQITNTTNNTIPDIGIDSSNIVHIVWADGNNSDIKYTNNTGGQFNSPVSIFTNSPLNAFPRIAVEDNGFVHIIWISTDESGDTEIYYVNNTAGLFGTPENVTLNNVDEYNLVAIEVDNNGIAHTVYTNDITGNNELYYKNNSLGDFSMNPVNISRNSANDFWGDIAIDSSGKVHITWASDVSGDEEIYYINNTLNEFTSIPVNISRDSNWDDYYSIIALDNSTTPNSVFICWVKDLFSPDYEIFTSNNYLGSFNTPQNISQSPNADYYADIAIDPIKKLAHFVWEAGNGDDDILYYYYNYYNPLNLLFPINSVYHYCQLVPIIVQNTSYIDKAWFRYDSGRGWSENYSLTYNGTYFIYGSTNWDEGNYRIQIFGNSSQSAIFMVEEWFNINASLPWNISLNSDEDWLPRLALDSLGNVHIVWSGSESGADEIYYDTNKDGYFGNKTQITNTTNNTFADIGIDSSNIVHIVWMDGNNSDIKYTNNTGGIFNTPVSISRNSPMNAYPRIIVEDNGFVHIMWASIDESGDIEIYYSNNTAGSFGTPENVTLNNVDDSGLFAIAVDNNGMAHIVYSNDFTGDDEIYYKNNSLGDFSMNPVDISRNPGWDDWGYDIAIDSSDYVHITWSSHLPGDDFEVFYINNTMNDFTSDPLNISRDPNNYDDYPMIALDKSTTPNSIFISWDKELTLFDYEIYTSNNYLGSFSSPKSISQRPDEDTYSDIAIDPINKLAHFVWEALDDVYPDYDILYYNYNYFPLLNLLSPINSVYYYHEVPIIVQNSTYIDKAWFRYDSGGGWSANFSLIYTGTNFINNSVTWDEENYHIQIFGNNSDNQIFMNEEWFSIDPSLPWNISLNFDQDYLPRIVLDSLGNTHVVWFGNESGAIEVYYDTNKDGHFGNKIQITNTTNNTFADIGIDSSNTVHIVWMDGDNLDIKYTNNTGGQFNPPNSISINSPMNAYPRIAVEDAGFVHILWVAIDESGDKEIYYINNTAGYFGIPENISLNNVDEEIFNAIAVDNNGIAHIAYTSELTFFDDEVYYKNNSLGDFSMNPINISRNTNWNDRVTDIAIDSSGYVHITWESEIFFNYEILYTNNIMNDFTSDPLNISRDPDINNYDFYPMLSLDNSTTPNSVFITWYKEQMLGDIEIYTSNNYQGSFSSPYNISQKPTDDFYSDIAIDSINKKAHIVWMGVGSDYEVYYYYYSYQSLELITPTNISYNYNDISIVVQNLSYINKMWVRNNSGGGWSNNETLIWNGTYFINSSPLVWNDGNYRLQVFGNNSENVIFMVEVWFTIDTAPPTGIQDPGNSNPQNNDLFGRIWVNGTASDMTSGIATIIVQSSNVTGGASWSVNQGNETNWGFYNVSYIPDNNAGEVYEINISIKDNAGNSNLIYCYIIVDNTPPSGSQDALTAQPQKNDISGYIWVNGTGSDLGSGIASVDEQSNNVTGGATWSVNQGTGTNWAFYNTSYIPDNNAGEVYEIIINITDNAGNSNLINCYIVVDNTPPTGAPGAYLSNPQNGTQVGLEVYFWLNGTAQDLGSGLLSVSIYAGNTSATWSSNNNTNQNWAFYNTTAIADNSLGEVYIVILNIFDIAGNYLNLTINFSVDTIGPSNITNLTDLNGSLTDDIVELNWTRSTDNNPVMYEIWRKTSPSGSWQLIATTGFNEYQYNDTGLSKGNYEYRIRPIDQAGNYGNSSNIITVEIKAEAEKPPLIPPLLPAEDNLWLILIIIGIAVGVIIAIVIAKKREPSPKKVTKPAKPTKKKEAPSLFETLTGPKEEKEAEAPPPTLPKEEKPAVKKVVEVKEFYYYCAKCDAYFKVPQKGQYYCPTCQSALEEYIS